MNFCHDNDCHDIYKSDFSLSENSPRTEKYLKSQWFMVFVPMWERELQPNKANGCNTP
jgi:hypothetical protein